MTDDGDDAEDADARDEWTTTDADHWPRELRGVTETVVATLGPNDRWNQAALGIHADGPESTRREPIDEGAAADGADGRIDAVTAYTYGNTRTRRNLHREGGGVVQFTPDPVDFATAALAVHETDEPVLDSTAAWVRVEATQTGTADRDGTTVETWRLEPRESVVVDETVPVVNRGHAAVVDATVAASRLGVAGYDDDALRDRLDHALDVATTCGGRREHLAIRFVADATDDWHPDDDDLPNVEDWHPDDADLPNVDD